MAFYNIEVVESTTKLFWVEADSPEEAREAGENLAYDVDAYIEDEDIHISKPQDKSAVPVGAVYWTGGESGEWAVRS